MWWCDWCVLSKDDGVYLDDANLDPLIDLLEELDLDTPDPNETSARSKRPSDSPPDDYEIKLPLPGDIKRVGNTIFCGAQKTGSVSYLVHWEWIIQWTISAVSLTLFVNASCQDELNHFLKAGDAIPIEICEP